MIVKIIEIDNQLGLVIPEQIIAELKLDVGSEIEVKAGEGVMLNKPEGRNKAKLPFTEEELIRNITDFRAYE